MSLYSAEGFDEVAEYLAKELAATPLYDVKAVQVKLKTALLLLSGSSDQHTQIKNIAARKNEYKAILLRKDEELKAWKSIVRELVGENAMAPYYERIREVQSAPVLT
ncbi:hypothetical protein [Rufibacter soli]